MTCNEFIDFLIEYYDGDLPADRRQLFEAHLAVCPDCVAYLESYKKTVEIVQESMSDPDGKLDADVPAGLVEAILAARSK